ncbi:hypothetical protein UT300012_23560 [Paraclostridium bifermentans]
MTTRRMSLGKKRRVDSVIDNINMDKSTGKGEHKLFYPLLDLHRDEMEEELFNSNCPHDFGVATGKENIDCKCSIDDCIKCWKENI